MKVKCIYNKKLEDLITIDKIYDAINENDCYEIINDKCNLDWFYKDWFKPLSEIRNEKINKLLK